MGEFFNKKLKNMRFIPKTGMEKLRQDFRKEQLKVVETPVTVIEPSKELTVREKRVAALVKARAARKMKNVAVANS